MDTFPYLGSLIAEDGECTVEFRTRLNKGQAIGASLPKIWKSHSIPIATKIRLMKALVWPVATYGCESWTLRKNEEACLDTFEMKGLRKILRVSWTAKKTNEWVLNKAGVKKELLDTVKARTILWSHHEETREMQGTMPGARRRRRPCTAWVDNIKTWTGLSVEESVRMTEDRDKWRKYSGLDLSILVLRRPRGILTPRLRPWKPSVSPRINWSCGSSQSWHRHGRPRVHH